MKTALRWIAPAALLAGGTMFSVGTASGQVDARCPANLVNGTEGNDNLVGQASTDTTFRR